MTAIGAGVFEAVLMATSLISDDVASAAEVSAGVTVRAAAFFMAAFLAVRMRRGRNWARLALVLLLGVLGTLSLVIGSIQWLLAGNSISAAVTDLGATGALFAASRAIHLAAVLGAVVSMFRPTANGYFRAAQRGGW
jgi:hypothetical protein